MMIFIYLFFLMKIPQLKKKSEIKTCHNTSWEDNYSWIHQDDILEVLKDNKKLNQDVRTYLEEENSYAEFYLSDTKGIQKVLFDEIKGRLKLDDESLPFKDFDYEYWTKTTAKGNYSIKLRKKIGSNKIEEIWNGDDEKEKLNVEYFGVGDLTVSFNDKYLGYSLDTKEIQQNLFNEIKGRIKLDDESLPFKDFDYEYWTKTTTKGNYSIKLRKKNWYKLY